ncbi:MAG: hypothetical protein ACI4A3_02455 [Lachnospiraceae bacterium]
MKLNLWLNDGDKMLKKIIKMLPIFLALIYYGGGNKLKMSKQIMLTQDKKYAMVYYNDDFYILKPAKIVDKKLYIDIDKQKIVDMKDTDLINYEGDIILD